MHLKMIMKRLKNSRMIKLFLHYTSILLPFFIISCNTSVIDNYEKSVLFCEKYGNDDFSIFEDVYMYYRGCNDEEYYMYVLAMPTSNGKGAILNVDYKDSIDYKIELSDICVFDTTKVLTLINKFRTYRLIELNTNDDGNLSLDFIDHGGSLIRFKDEAEKDKVLLRSPKLIRISDLWYYRD